MPKPKLITEGSLKEIAMQWSGADVPETDFRSITYWQALKNRVPEFSEKLKLAARLKLSEYPENLKDIKHSIKFWRELAEILGLPSVPENRQRSIVFWVDWYKKAKVSFRIAQKRRKLDEITERLNGLPKLIGDAWGDILDGGPVLSRKFLEEFPSEIQDKFFCEYHPMLGIDFDEWARHLEVIQCCIKVAIENTDWSDPGGGPPPNEEKIKSFFHECIKKDYALLTGKEPKSQDGFIAFARKLMIEVGIKKHSKTTIKRRAKQTGDVLHERGQPPI